VLYQPLLHQIIIQQLDIRQETAVTTGTHNTLIGALAGDALTDADENVAVGYGALSTDTLGKYSVAIG